MKFEAQIRRDVRVRILFEGQPDIQAHRQAARVRGPAVGGFHDARPAARADHETVRVVGELLAPLREHARQSARVVVVARQLAFPLADAGRAEEDHGIAHFFTAEVRHRFQEFREYAQPSRVRTSQKLVVQIRYGASLAMWWSWCGWVRHSS